MKNTKRLLSLILAIVMLVACMLLVTSCKKNKDKDDHTHSYTSAVTAPTCVEQGYTTYTCECGDKYVADYVPTTHNMTYHAPKASTCKEAGHNGYNGCDVCGAKDDSYKELPLASHDYKAVITEYPSATKNGTKTFTCTVCGDSYTDKIDAFTAYLPDASASLAEMIKGTYKLGAKKGSNVVFVTELSDYTNASSEKVFFALNLAEAMISSDGTVATGYLKIEFGTATKLLDGSVPSSEVTMPASFDSAGAIEFYLNGDDISVSMEIDGITEAEDFKVNEIFYSAVASALGMSYESFINAVYIGNKAIDLTEVAVMLIAGLQNINFPEKTGIAFADLENVFAVFGSTIFEASTDANGNTVYSLNVDALKELSKALDNSKTVAEFIDNLYGEGSFNSITVFVTSIPDLTIRDITNSVVYYANLAGVDEYQVYEILDMIIYMTSGVEISIQDEIQKSFNKTVADIVADNAVASNSGVDRENVISAFKIEINRLVYEVSTFSPEELVKYFFAFENQPDVIESINNAIDALDDATTVELTVNENGEIIALIAEYYDMYISAVFENDGATITITEDFTTILVTISDEKMNVKYLIDNEVFMEFDTTYTSVTNGELLTEVYTMLIVGDGDKLIEGSLTLENGIFKVLDFVTYSYAYGDSDDDNNNNGNTTPEVNAATEPEVSVTTNEFKIEYTETDGIHKVIITENNENTVTLTIGTNPDNSGFSIIVSEDEVVTFVMGAYYSSTTEGDTTKEVVNVLVMEDDVILFNAVVTLENGIFKELSVEANGYEYETNAPEFDNSCNGDVGYDETPADPEPIAAEEDNVVNYLDFNVKYVESDQNVRAYVLTSGTTVISFMISEDPHHDGHAISIEEDGKVVFYAAVAYYAQAFDEVTGEIIFDGYYAMVQDDENTLLFAAIYHDKQAGTVTADLEINNYTYIYNDDIKPEQSVPVDPEIPTEPQELEEITYEEPERIFENIVDIILVYTKDNNTVDLYWKDELKAGIAFVSNEINKGFHFVTIDDAEIIVSISGNVFTETVTEGEDTTTTDTLTFNVSYEGDVLMDLNATFVNGEMTKGSFVQNYYSTEYEEVYDDQTGKVIDCNSVTKLESNFDFTFNCTDDVITFVDNITGGSAKIEILENGLTLTVTGETNYYGEFTVVTTETSSTINVLFTEDETTVFHYNYSVTSTPDLYEVTFYYEVNGKVYYDVNYGLYSIENGVKFKYDVDRFVVPQFDFVSNESNVQTPDFDVEIDWAEGENTQNGNGDFIYGSSNVINNAVKLEQDSNGDYYYFHPETGEKVYVNFFDPNGEGENSFVVVLPSEEYNYVEETYVIEGEGEFTFEYIEN